MLRFWGLPSDVVSWAAVALAVGLAIAWPRLAGRGSDRHFVLGGAILAALLSAGYVAVYLRGGPRIIDATTYWLEARAMSHGALAWAAPDPVTEVAGRFLVIHDGPDGTRVAGIFPPGYPALLALGFLIGAPMAIGPLLAGALVWATWWLAFNVAEDAEGGPLGATMKALPRLAVAFGIACAALRYHTADTMSHGLAALCLTVAAAAALHLRRAPTERAWAVRLGLGLALGWLLATRPVSAMPAVLLVGALFALSPRRRDLARGLPIVAVGALPGVVLLALHQKAATGAWLTSSQLAYYARADGPPGCFRYGFGDGVGCMHEHGDFVREYMPEGFSGFAAVGPTLRRLAMHVMDIGNVELLAPVVLLGVLWGWRVGAVRWLALATLLFWLAYAPFYFDGNYPGGGARLFADLLPIEHVLLAVGVLGLARRWGSRRVPGLMLALCLLGFAVRAGHHHAHLRDREGGRPMFEPGVVQRAGVREGLVFVDTDHGFNLAHDPFDREPVSYVRSRGDALDVLSWARHGHPPAYRYELDPSAPAGSAHPKLVPMRLSADAATTIEGESLWPPRRQQGAWMFVEHASGECASGDRRLGLRDGGGPGEVELDVPAGAVEGQSIRLVVAVGEGAEGAQIALRVDRELNRTWPLAPRNGEAWSCRELDPAPIAAGAERVRLVLRSQRLGPGSTLALDRITVAPPP